MIDGSERDASIRPNQIFAVSLRHGMLSHERESAASSRSCNASCSPARPSHSLAGQPGLSSALRGRSCRARFGLPSGNRVALADGSLPQRIPQGSCGSEPAKAQAREWLQPFAAHLTSAGLGQISEIADGDPPHTPRGCIAQAWSVAEILRAALEAREFSQVCPRNADN